MNSTRTEVERPVELVGIEGGAPTDQEATEAQPDPVEEPSTSSDSQDLFPYGMPTPDWVFEQKYAGLSRSQLDEAKASVEAEYKLASQKAINECYDTGDYEVIPEGESTGGVPGDDRIIAGRNMPGSHDQQVVRLDKARYPQVYALFYEYLWLATSRK